MKIRVLIVEDDDITAHIIDEVLKRSKKTFQFDVTRVCNLPSAKEHIEKHKYDCILLDLFLPPHNVDDTFEWLEKYRWNDCAVVVIMTGYVAPGVKKWMKRLGLRFLLPKEELMEDFRGLSLILVQALNHKNINNTLRCAQRLRE